MSRSSGTYNANQEIDHDANGDGGLVYGLTGRQLGSGHSCRHVPCGQKYAEFFGALRESGDRACVLGGNPLGRSEQEHIVVD